MSRKSPPRTETLASIVLVAGAMFFAACEGSPRAVQAMGGIGGYTYADSSGASGAGRGGGGAASFFSGDVLLVPEASQTFACVGSCSYLLDGPSRLADGRLVVGGALDGTFTSFGGASRQTEGLDAFFTLFAEPTLAAETRFFAGPSQTLGARAFAAGSSIALVTSLSGPLDLSGEVAVEPPAGASSATLVATFGDLSGPPRFARIFPDLAFTALAGSPTGGVAFAAYGGGELDLGCGPVSAPLGASLVVQLGSGGDCLFQRVLGDFDNVTTVDALAYGYDGSLALVGRFQRSLVLGTQSFEGPSETAFAADLFADGEPRWAKAFPARNPDGSLEPAPMLSVVRDGFGSFLVTALSRAPLDFGGGPRGGGAAAPVGHVARFDLEGVPLWHEVLPAVDALAPALTPEGTAFLGGSFHGEIAFRSASGTNAALVSAGRADGFLVELEPGGAARWSVRFGDAYDDGVRGLSVTQSGLVVAGSALPGTPASLTLFRVARPPKQRL